MHRSLHGPYAPGPYAVAPKQTQTLELSPSTLSPSTLSPSTLSPSPPLDGENTEAQGSAAVHLDADLYYPLGEGPFPVLLMRQPYGRAIASTVVYAHPTWYASHGYIVVIQDVRGRGTSGGEFELFRHEATDGYATVQWAAGLPNSNGKVGMYGFSYQGITQLHAAAQKPPALRAIAPAMVGYDLYADWAYENGALPLQVGLGWALQLAAETARLNQDREAYQALFQAAHALPLADTIPACPQVLKTYAPESFFHQWLAHPEPDDYWRQLTPDLTNVDLPMLHIGGWYDPYLRGDLRLYQQMVAQSDAPQPLWIGPWGHLPWGRRIGAVDFGPGADSPIDRLQIRWFDQFLKDQPQELPQDHPVQLFVMGVNHWQGCDRWPTSPGQSFYLSSTGLAAMRSDDGMLSPQFPASPSTPTSADVIVHDPWRPVPSLGGHGGLPAGPFDRSAIDSRTDVLTYTTNLFTEALTLIGTPIATLYCRADAPSFDLSVVLSEVHSDGRVMNLTQGHCRIDHHDPANPSPQPITLPLQPTACVLPPGHRLRLSIAAACFPAYAVNSGTGASPGNCPQIDHRVITLAIAQGSQHPSCIQLPLGDGQRPA